MSSPAAIKRRLEQNWIQFLKANSAKLSIDSIHGSSPPSVFVGRHGYPKVRLGPMIPPICGNTSIFDKPEEWAGKSIEEIANYRLSLVRGTFTMNVRDTSGRYLESIQELAMSEKPADSEATFENNVLGDRELEKEVRLNSEVALFGPAAPLKTFKTTSLSADQRIEKAYYDKDLRASDAIVELYKRGVNVSSINRVLSVGMLGQKKSRRLVPTRWSISTTDDILSKTMVIENKENPTIDHFEVTQYSHLANYYSIILLPDKIWSFEMIESWFTKKGEVAFGSDYEDAGGIDHYPTIAGAYFAGRLGIAEHLSNRQRKAAAIVLREIHPEYVMPLGVWQIREAVREALKKSPEKFDTLESALGFAISGMSLSGNEIARKSKLVRLIKNQTRITDFA